MTEEGERTALRAGLDFIVPVWGAEYTRCFVDLCLPSFLAPGNIPAMPLAERHVFRIYTTTADRATIEASPAFRLLARHIRVEFHRVRVRDPLRNVNRFSVQSDCYRRAIREADAADRAMVFVTPDMLMADGSLRNLAAIADRAGVRTILGAGVRLVKETAGAELLRHHRAGDGEPVVIGPRALVRLLLQHMHPIARAHFFHAESESDGIILANLYWRAGSEGLVARCFYLHPLMVYPRVKNVEFANTVDSDYVEAACPDPAEAYIVTDSDEICVCELSPASRTQTAWTRADPAPALKWMRQWTTPRHRTLIKSTLRIHAGIGDASLWQRVERQAEADVAALLSSLYATGAAEAAGGGGYIEATQGNVPICFVTALRDAAEARDFVDLALPSVLAPANIPAQVEKRKYVYRIAAAPEALAVLEASGAFRELRTHVRVDLESCDAAAMRAEGFADSFRIEAIAAADSARMAAMFIEPASVLADNSLQMIRGILRMNMRAILVPRLTLRRASAAAALRRDFLIEGILSIRPDELIALAFGHLHPLAEAQFRDTGDGPADPVTLCWKVGAEGVLIHAFDYYPLVINSRGAGRAADAVDHPLLGALGFGPNEISIIRDSKVLAYCVLRDEEATAPLLPRRDPAAIAAWAAEHAGAFSRLLFRNEIRLFAGETQSPAWSAVSARASGTVLEVLAALASAGDGRRGA